jgi:hypothetical protein
MTQEHPITPPPKLVQQWMFEFYGAHIVPGKACTDLANRASQWGADQELEACFDFVYDKYEKFAEKMQAARRPKPPSLKEQALAAQQRMWDGGSTHEDWQLIRRALEQLDD